MTTSIRPTPTPPRDYRFPRCERLALDNGLKLVIASVDKLPVVSIAMVVDAGSSSEPAGREGVAHITAHALAEGTARFTGHELAERFELLGASLDSRADWDAAIVSTTVLSSRFDDALALMSEVLREPSFPDREIERLKGERLAELLQLQAEPRGLADEMFNRFLYDSTSRYARPELGGADTVGALSAEEVRAFYKSRYVPGAMTLVVAGNVSVSHVQSVALRVFEDWESDTPPAAVVLDQPARHYRAVHIVRKEDAPQSELRLGHVGLPRVHPDYFPVLVMNSILGGLFGSRINLNLRERHGFTYGARSEYDWRRGAGPFAVSTAVKSDATGAAVRETLMEVERIRSESVSSEELSLATSYLAGVFPIRFESTAAIARALVAQAVFGLPDDYFDTYRRNVTSVTSQAVHRAAELHVHPDLFQLVVVGDPNVARAQLASAELGVTTIYDADGEPEPTI
ncbi:MAG: M16 family metallopeptidase [Gemmatimonadaceae bacterium]